jgi:hypothetical protein
VLCTVGAGFLGWTIIQDDHVDIELTAEQQRLEPTGLGQASAMGIGVLARTANT